MFELLSGRLQSHARVRFIDPGENFGDGDDGFAWNRRIEIERREKLSEVRVFAYVHALGKSELQNLFR